MKTLYIVVAAMLLCGCNQGNDKIAAALENNTQAIQQLAKSVAKPASTPAPDPGMNEKALDRLERAASKLDAAAQQMAENQIAQKRRDDAFEQTAHTRVNQVVEAVSTPCPPASTPAPPPPAATPTPGINLNLQVTGAQMIPDCPPPVPHGVIVWWRQPVPDPRICAPRVVVPHYHRGGYGRLPGENCGGFIF